MSFVPSTDDVLTAALLRFDSALQPLGQIPMVANDAESAIADLALTDDGTAYLAVLVSSPLRQGVELQLSAVAPGAPSPSVVTSFPALDYFLGVDRAGALAVDPAGKFAYVAGLPNGAYNLRLTLTPVTLSTD